jgi:hypothetical protein
MNRWDHPLIGILIGLLGVLIGYLAFACIFTWKEDLPIASFFEEVFLRMEDFQSRILSFAALADIGLFYLFLKKEMYRVCKGITFILLLAVIGVVMLY